MKKALVYLIYHPPMNLDPESTVARSNSGNSSSNPRLKAGLWFHLSGKMPLINRPKITICMGGKGENHQTYPNFGSCLWHWFSHLGNPMIGIAAIHSRPQVPKPCLFAGSSPGPHLQPLITVLGKQLEGLCKAACSKKRRGFGLTMLKDPSQAAYKMQNFWKMIWMICEIWPWHQFWVPSGELTFCNGKSPFLMGKSTISMAIFHCYVSSPESTIHWDGAFEFCAAGRGAAGARQGESAGGSESVMGCTKASCFVVKRFQMVSKVMGVTPNHPSHGWPF